MWHQKKNSRTRCRRPSGAAFLSVAAGVLLAGTPLPSRAATLQYQIATKDGFVEQFAEDEIPFGGSFSASLTNGGSSGRFAIDPAGARVRAEYDWDAGSSGGTSVNVTITDTIVMQPPAGSPQSFAAWLSVTIGVSGSLTQSGGSASWTAGAQLQSPLYLDPIAGFVQPRIRATASGSESAAFGSSGTSLPATFSTSVLAGTTDVFLFNTPIFLSFGFGASADGSASGGGFARANLQDTILWLGITARDADGNVIEGVTFNSTSGIDWGSPPAPIPLPAASWLLLTGLGVFGVRIARRGRAVQPAAPWQRRPRFGPAGPAAAVMALCALLAAIPGKAAPVEGAAAFSVVNGSCTAGAPQVVESISTPILYVPLSVSCDVSGTDSTSVGSTQAVAQALTTFGYPAAADAQTSVSGTGRGTAQVSVSVQLAVVLQQLAAPPVETAVIPIRVDAPYAMNVSEDAGLNSGGGSRATATLAVFGGLVAGTTLQDVLSLGSGATSATREGTFRWRGNLVIDEENPSAASLGFRINATCRSSISIGFGNDVSYATGCQSIIDPLFFFDQEEFDSLMGEDTFRLSDFFELGLPENVGQPPAVVPLPGAAWLFGSALLVLARRRRS